LVSALGDFVVGVPRLPLPAKRLHNAASLTGTGAQRIRLIHYGEFQDRFSTGGPIA